LVWRRVYGPGVGREGARGSGAAGLDRGGAQWWVGVVSSV
jgi:hypothetical protein